MPEQMFYLPSFSSFSSFSTLIVAKFGETKKLQKTNLAITSEKLCETNYEREKLHRAYIVFQFSWVVVVSQKTLRN